ncbi:hypothetical protein HRI_005252700 [Hibiscus trionum]|uniref:Formin-like protein n=1 Tax=Hibiscus trionum TaxID=183268 RepID=A0A9W7MWZ5_HIBTR|nr:hypothetical protein HRI_005252700 [Hibiscus trionum]
MALFKKIFHKKPLNGIVEFSERVYVFSCCLSTDIWEDIEFKIHIEGILRKLLDQFSGASFMVYNFQEGEHQSRIASILSKYNMTVKEYPRQYEGCPILTLEVIGHFLKSSENWFSSRQQNLILMHCERGGWPVLAFLLAALMLYRKQSSSEQKTLELTYKRAPRELLQLTSLLNPLPSQLRYLQYVSTSNMGSQWPPSDRPLTLDCVILRCIPNTDGEGGCRPIFRIYGQDPLMAADKTPKVLFSTPKKSKLVQYYRQVDNKLVKFDIHCHVVGDVVIECISLDSDQQRELLMFRVMFNTAFIKSYMLMLNREEIDILWNAKDRFPKDFRAEVIFSDMDVGTSAFSTGLSGVEEKGGLPVEAFAKVQEIFGNGDWLSPTTDASNILQRIPVSNMLQGKLETVSLKGLENANIWLDDKAKGKLKSQISEHIITSQTCTGLEKESTFSFNTSDENANRKKFKPQEIWDAPQKSAQPTPCLRSPYDPSPVEGNTELQELQVTPQGSEHSKISIKPSAEANSSRRKAKILESQVALQKRAQYMPSFKATTDAKSVRKKIEPQGKHNQPLTSSSVPSLSLSETLNLMQHSFGTTSLNPPSHGTQATNEALLPYLSVTPSVTEKYDSTRSSACQPPSFPPTAAKNTSQSSRPPLPLPPLTSFSGEPSSPLVKQSLPSVPTPSHPPPPLSSYSNVSYLVPDSPLPSLPNVAYSNAATCSVSSPQLQTSGPPPTSLPSGSVSDPTSQSSVPQPPSPPLPSLAPNGPSNKSVHVPPVPPPPAPCAMGLSRATPENHGSVPSIPGPPPLLRGRSGARIGSKNQAQTRKANLKPYHWMKLTRVSQGSLWADAQKPDEAAKAAEFDMSELESLFSANSPTANSRSKHGKGNSKALGRKPDKVQLIELRRAYNCEIMLTKVKIPLPELTSAILALDDTALDPDQLENLIKYCPTKEEIELLTGYKGDKGNLGKCEQFFLELMTVPRVESKLRVFLFKMQFHSQVSELRNSLGIVNSAVEEVRNSVKLKRIMQTILSLGNALNQGTARGSAVGFRLDSLLKLTDTRARSKKMTLMHFLCKVLDQKLPELLDFPKDLPTLEAATKIQLKCLADETQAFGKGLEKVVEELYASENDGPVSETFCKTLREFLGFAEEEVKSLILLQSCVGKNADSLAHYFGEDPARCPFEQVMSTLLSFSKMFVRAHEENCKQLEVERKKAKEAENKKLKK